MKNNILMAILVVLVLGLFAVVLYQARLLQNTYTAQTLLIQANTNPAKVTTPPVEPKPTNPLPVISPVIKTAFFNSVMGAAELGYNEAKDNVPFETVSNRLAMVITYQLSQHPEK